MAEDTPATLDPSPDEELTPRERLAAVLERWLDIPMAVLAVVWAVLVAYELGLAAYAVVVVAAIAAALGAFFLESRAERAAHEEGGAA